VLPQLEGRNGDMTLDLSSGRHGVPGGKPDRKPPAFGLVRFFTLAGATTFAAAVIGFFGFVYSLDRAEPASVEKADGIVVLTGGADRIQDGLEWLRKGRGQRLLISGVSTQISPDQLKVKVPTLTRWHGCCVDLDYAAANTVGNAVSTRHWAKQKGYHSLLVVTSSYHMPRATLELRRHMPEVTLIQAPVVTNRVQGMDLIRDPELLKVIGIEYGKFVVAWARASLTTAPPTDDVTAGIGRQRI
jgi:uncharacterized SAM-binding protein YcdF (DUF218 family)